MRGHIVEEQWIDVFEGVAEPPVRRHLEECASCRATADDMRSSWALAREVDVPEPSPLYWESFRRRVGRAIAEEGAAPRRRLLAPQWLIVAASLVVAVAVFQFPGWKTSTPLTPATGVTLEAWSPLPAAKDDEALPVLAAASEAGEALCADVASCVMDLSAIETEGLDDALHELSEQAS